MRKGKYFSPAKSEKKATLHKCNRYLNMNTCQDVKEIEETYNKVNVVERIKEELVFYCINNMKNWVCVLKQAVALIQREVLNFIRLVPKNTGHRRKVEKALIVEKK